MNTKNICITFFIFIVLFLLIEYLNIKEDYYNNKFLEFDKSETETKTYIDYCSYEESLGNKIKNDTKRLCNKPCIEKGPPEDLPVVASVIPPS